jgi:hypothetical protein
VRLLLVSIVCLSLVKGREYLRDDRHAHWESEDANHGPYYGQPEQVHLAYDGE